MRVLRQDGAEPGAIVRHIWQSGLIALAAAALVFLLARTTPFQDFDRWTYDFTVINAGLQPPDKRIVLVDFDDETFEKVKQFPIPRSLVANTVTAIAAQKPRTVGMDILLTEPRAASEDKAMQDALTAAGNVILTSQYSGGDIPTDMPLSTFCQPEDPHLVSGFCKEGTPGALGYAYINMPVDPDGFVRQAMMLSSATAPAPGFAATMVQQYSGQPIELLDRNRFKFLGRTLWFSDPALKEFLIGSWGRQPATTIPAWKVLAGGLPADTFTDKLVLMGQSSDAARDRHYTPMFRYSLPDGSRPSMAGTQVMAAAIKSLLDGTIVRPSPHYIVEIAIVAMCWVCSFIVLELRTKVGMTVAVIFLSVPFLLALGLYIHARFWLPFLGQEAGLAMTLPFTLFVQFIAERVLAREARSQRLQLMTLFSSYVDPAVAGTIWERRDEVSLNGEERIATVMFTDIRSFTALSAGKPPAEVLTWLNQYMTAMDGVIRLHGGFLNKFIGDGLMIIFGLPLSHGVRHDAERGLHAAIAMLERVEQLNVENAPFPDRPQLRIGVGIHTGKLMAGSIGSASRQEYSVIGETVNLASRLESLNKPMKTEILMSKATYDLLSEDFTGFEALGPAKVAGFEEPVDVYTIRTDSKKQ